MMILEYTGKRRMGRAVWRTVDRLSCCCDYNDKDEWPMRGWCVLDISVPPGFETDLASIPRCFWPWLLPDSLGLEAPIFHDYLCEIGAPRTLADGVFLEIMRFSKVSRTRRLLAWSAVRLFWILSGKWKLTSGRKTSVQSSGCCAQSGAEETAS